MGDMLYVDPNRDALRKPHPGEDWVDIGKPLPVGLRVRDVDGAGDAVDMAADDLGIAHQFDACWIADADWSEIGLLEITVDPERVGIDNGDDVRPDIGVVAELSQ